MRAALTVLRWIAAGLLVLFLIAWLPVGPVLWRAWEALPRTQGELQAAGLDAPVTVLRDARGVPHITAQTDHDAAFAMGFVHAQDRLWQMHVNRWYLRGEMAGVLGALAADSDAQMRTYGLGASADALAAAMTAEELAPFAAYAAGVNAAMASRGFVPPLEFLMLGVAPQAWKPEDSLLIYKGLALDLMNGEAFRAYGASLLRQILTEEQIAEFQPPYPADAPVTLSAQDLGLASGAPPAPPPPGGRDVSDAPRDGSNAWVVSGAHTASGLPLLANDPHLNHRAPGTWHLAAVRTPQGATVGAAVPGAPAIVIGRNNHIAWGMTITGADVADLVFQPESAVIEEWEETVPVRFGEDRTVRLRRTADGPVLPPELFAQGTLAPEGQVAVLRWPLDDAADRTAAAAAPLNRARNWGEFQAALAGFYAPMVNVMFAAADGDIGILSPAWVPVRNAAGDWVGAIPTAELPRAHNPADGVIVNANNRLTPDEYPYALTGDWAPPFRAMRAEALLAETQSHTPQSFAAIQTDTVDLAAVRALPVLLEAAPGTDAGQNALERMRGWDGDMAADSAEALIYAAWMQAMARAVYGDEFGENYARFASPRSQFMDHVLSGDSAAWCDNTGTDATETCADIAGPALDDAVAALTAEHGRDMDSWRWGAAHQAYFPHAPFSVFPVLDGLFSARVAAGGNGTTLNEAGFSYGGGYASQHGPSLRVIYDLADPDASLFAMPMGQSGHRASPHYKDLLQPWADGEYFEIRTDLSADAPPEGARILTLTPQ